MKQWDLIRPVGGAALIVVAAVLYVPVLVTVSLSFNSAPRGWVWQHFSLAWYGSVWSDTFLLSALTNSLLIAIITVALSVPIGLILSYYLLLASGRLQFAVSLLVLLPVLVPDLLLSIAHAILYRSLQLPMGLATIAVSESLVGSAYLAVLVTISLRTLELDSLAKAARSLGASEGAIMRHVVIPLARSPILVGLGFIIIYSLQDFLFAFFVGGPGSTTLAVYIQSQVRFGPNGGTNVIYTLTVLASLALCWAASRNRVISRVY